MTTTKDARLGGLLARVEVVEAIDRHFRTIDDGPYDDDWARRWFTNDVRLEYPPGTVEGIEAVAPWTRRIMSLWDRTLHRTSNHVVDVSPGGDRASVTFTLVATHVRRDDDRGDHLHIGGHVDAELVGGPGGWRFRRQRLTLVWTQGDPPTLPAAPPDAGPAANGHRYPPATP